jgi:hypothetical protein
MTAQFKKIVGVPKGRVKERAGTLDGKIGLGPGSPTPGKTPPPPPTGPKPAHLLEGVAPRPGSPAPHMRGRSSSSPAQSPPPHVAPKPPTPALITATPPSPELLLRTEQASQELYQALFDINPASTENLDGHIRKIKDLLAFGPSLHVPSHTGQTSFEILQSWKPFLSLNPGLAKISKDIYDHFNPSDSFLTTISHGGLTAATKAFTNTLDETIKQRGLCCAIKRGDSLSIVSLFLDKNVTLSLNRLKETCIPTGAVVNPVSQEILALLSSHGVDTEIITYLTARNAIL